MRAKKQLGQHFLNNERALDRIVEAAAPTEGESVLEIGPGSGALTRKLLDTGAHVVAIEKDTELMFGLQERFAQEIAEKRLNIVRDDVLTADLAALGFITQQFSVVANIPYYITGQILRLLLAGPIQPRKTTLLVQREIAERITAKDNKQSILSISVQTFGSPRMAGIVRAGAFTPPPNVDSAILVIDDISQAFFSHINKEAFFTFVKAHFVHKRKQLGTAGLISSETFATCTVAPTARPEELSKEDWKCLFEQTQHGATQ